MDSLILGQVDCVGVDCLQCTRRRPPEWPTQSWTIVCACEQAPRRCGSHNAVPKAHFRARIEALEFALTTTGSVFAPCREHDDRCPCSEYTNRVSFSVQIRNFVFMFLVSAVTVEEPLLQFLPASARRPANRLLTSRGLSPMESTIRQGKLLCQEQSKPRRVPGLQSQAILLACSSRRDKQIRWYSMTCSVSFSSRLICSGLSLSLVTRMSDACSCPRASSTLAPPQSSQAVPHLSLECARLSSRTFPFTPHGNASAPLGARHTRQPCSSSRRATLTSHLFNECEPIPEFLDRVLRRSPSPALMTDQPNPRQTDKLHILSRNPGPARGLDQRALADHLNGPCHIVCVQEGSGFVTDNEMQVNFYVVTQHPCAVLLNKDTFEYDISCTPFQVPCSLRCASWAVQGMAVTGEFRGSPWIFSGPAPLMSCPRWFSLNRVLTSLS